MNKINFGIIGAGQIVRDAYLPILPFLDMIDNAYLYDINIDSMNTAISEYNKWLKNGIFPKDYSHAFKNAEAQSIAFKDKLKIITDKEQFAKICDVILICTPPNTHLSNAEYFLAKGKKVIVEKPIDINLQAINNLMSKHGDIVKKNLRYIENFVYNPCFNKVKQMLEDGQIGEVSFIKTFFANTTIASKNDSKHWRFNKDISGGGVMFDWAPHTFSTSMLLAGTTDVTNITSYSVKYAADLDLEKEGYESRLDVYNLSMITLNKNNKPINVLVENSWLASKDLNEPGGRSWISIDGSLGNITIQQVKQDNKKAYLVKTSNYREKPLEELMFVEFPHDAYYYALKNILDNDPKYAELYSIGFAEKILKMITTIVDNKPWQKE